MALGMKPRRVTAVAAAAAACLALSACSSEDSSSVGESSGNSIEVREATWHDGEWPFKVPRGILGCTAPGEVTFNVEGTVYGLNGTALDHGLPEVNPIWRPTSEGLKVDIGGMIDRGLKLCEEAE